MDRKRHHAVSGGPARHSSAPPFPMAGLVRGACVTGGWSVEQAQRDAFVGRITDNLASAAFHYSKARATTPLC